MKKAIYEFKVPDDFEPYHCHACPLYIYDQYYDADGNMDDDEYCVIAGRWGECPLKIKEKDNV